MPPDFRSDPMETPEGKGIAKRAWEAYAGVIQKTIYRPLAPFLDPMNESLSCQVVEDLLGFWVMWHLYGGFEGLERFGMHKSTIWRKVARFRRVIGVHPDEYEMPGITIDPGQYWSSSVRKVGRQP
ncbi:MAG: hypothetical protein WAV54_01075 [Acidimicrobiales bacterium]